jgi:hypothetical protein
MGTTEPVANFGLKRLVSYEFYLFVSSRHDLLE